MLAHVEAKAFEIEGLIDYAFADKHLVVEAVQMAAPQVLGHNNNLFVKLDNNKRLSILGELVLTRELCTAWFRHRGLESCVLSPAQWNQLRNDIISNHALAERGFDIGLDKVIIAAENTPAVSPRMVATALGAIIGAVHEDGGDYAVHSVMEHLGFFNHILLTVTFPLIHFPP